MLYKAQSTGVHSVHQKASQALSRFLVLKCDQISWYHNREEYDSGKYIGIAKLNFVYDLMKVPNILVDDNQELHGFKISVSMHQSRKK